MRILWVKAGRLLPVDTGGKSRSYNLLRNLAARNEVTLLSYYGGARDVIYETELAKHLPGAVSINTGVYEETTLQRGLDYARRFFSSAPYAVAKFTDPKVRRQINEWFDAGRFDVAVCDFLSASLNFPRLLKTPTVLFQHNVESILWQRQAQHEPERLKRLVFQIEAAKMSSYERAAVARFQHVIAVSDYDREQMSTMTDPARISVVPTGVDLRQFSAARGASAEQPLVVFLGSMDWEANVDGVDYFCREIWPQVRQAVPGARFRIVGRNPQPRVRKLASDDIEVTGTVQSVIEHVREAAVFVVPLRIGGGTRLKIYEAMAMGKAVVSTTIGAEGLDVNDGKDIWLADDPASFAQAVIKLLRMPIIRQKIEAAAAEQAARYDWPVVARQFEAVLAQAQIPFNGVAALASVVAQVNS